MTTWLRLRNTGLPTTLQKLTPHLLLILTLMLYGHSVNQRRSTCTSRILRSRLSNFLRHRLVLRFPTRRRLLPPYQTTVSTTRLSSPCRTSIRTPEKRSNHSPRCRNSMASPKCAIYLCPSPATFHKASWTHRKWRRPLHSRHSRTTSI